MKTLLILFLIFASFLKGADTMKTVDSVDLEKFMGKWFVIALVPNMIEKGATNSSDLVFTSFSHWWLFIFSRIRIND